MCPGVAWIFLARILEWVVISSSRETSKPSDQTRVSCVFCFGGGFFIAYSAGKPWQGKWNKTWLTPSHRISSDHFGCSVVSDSLWPIGRSTPGLPVHHQLPESTQTHVHWISDAIQPSHPLSFPSPALNLSQHQGLFKWVSSSHQVAKVLEFQLQQRSWHPAHHFLANRWRNSGKSARLYFLGFQNHCRWWLQPWN